MKYCLIYKKRGVPARPPSAQERPALRFAPAGRSCALGGRAGVVMSQIEKRIHEREISLSFSLGPSVPTPKLSQSLTPLREADCRALHDI